MFARFKILGELSLMLVHAEESLGSKRRNEEERRRPGRDLRVRQRQDRDGGRVERNRGEEQAGVSVREESADACVRGSGL